MAETLRNKLGRLLTAVGFKLNPNTGTSLFYGTKMGSAAYVQETDRKHRYLSARRIMLGQSLCSAAIDVRAGNSTIPNRSKESPLNIHSENESVKQILEDITQRLKIKDRLFTIQKSLLMFGDRGYELYWDRSLITAMVPTWKPDYIVSKKYSPSGMLMGYNVAESDAKINSPRFIPWDRYVHFSDDPEEPFGKGVLFSVNYVELDYRFARTAMILARINRGEDRLVLPADISNAFTAEERMKIYDEVLSKNKGRKVIDSAGRLLPDRHPLEAMSDIVVGVRPDEGQYEAKVNKVPKQENLDDIEDIRYLRDEMLAPIGVPKRYLQQDKDITAKASLDRQDLQLLRLCVMDQQHLLRGIRFIFDLQLAALGYDTLDIDNRYTVGIVDLELDDEKLYWDIELVKAKTFEILYNKTPLTPEYLIKTIYKLSETEAAQILGLLQKIDNPQNQAQEAQIARAFENKKEREALMVIKNILETRFSANHDLYQR